MIPTYPYSVSSSPMPFIDLNEDQNHQASSSSSSLSFNPILLNPHDQDHAGSYLFEPKPLQTDHEEAAKIVPYSGSWDNLGEEKDDTKRGLKLRVWKKGAGDRDDENLNHQGDREEDDSGKWMSSKMRMMRKMMVSDQTGCDTSRQKFEDHIQKQQSLSPLGTDNSSSNSSPISNSNNITVRVCADCHTTKTPLWRSGPRGPKSLCNACGIRQRKARRAMAAAAATSANGAVMAVERSSVKGNKLHRKEKKNSKIELKKKRKIDHDGEEAKPSPRKKFGFEDFTISLSKNLALQVFPQDEKEAAILLMALSCGLVHG